MATTVIKEGQPGSKAGFKDSFLMHKLHSLSGVIPIGAFMVFHLVANSYSLRGEVEFNTVVKVIGYLPFVQIIEIVGIFVPIIFHAVYGMIILREMQSIGGNTVHYGYARNWLYVLQRWSGVAALGYIGYHVWSTTGHRWAYEFSGDPEAAKKAHAVIAYTAMAYRFADIGYLLFYLAGILAAVFHFANGMFNFGIRWGITIGNHAQKIAVIVWAAVGIGLLGLGWGTAINFHLKGKAYPVPQFAASGAPMLDSEGKPKVSIENLRQKYPTLEALVEATKEHSVAKTPEVSRPDTNPADDSGISPGATTGSGDETK